MKKSLALLATFVIASTHQTLLGDWAYSVSDNQATITSYSGDGGEVVIPAVMNEIPVVKVGNEAFKYNASVTNITIPDSVTSIGNEAFWYCTSLTSITIPDSVESIGYAAFNGCTSLTKVTLPKLLVGDYESFGLSADQIQFK